jgi:hypothetical protein
MKKEELSKLCTKNVQVSVISTRDGTIAERDMKIEELKAHIAALDGNFASAHGEGLGPILFFAEHFHSFFIFFLFYSFFFNLLIFFLQFTNQNVFLYDTTNMKFTVKFCIKR